MHSIYSHICIKLVEESKQKWFNWLTKAAEAGLQEAQWDFIERFRETDRSQMSPKEIKNYHLWLMSFAKAGNSLLQFRLGRQYLRDGDPLERNCTKALEWLGKSADQNFPNAINTLGEMALNGNCLVKSNTKAADYFHKASKLSNWMVPQLNLGKLLSTHPEIKFDPKEALIYIRKAASYGDASAHAALARKYYSDNDLSKAYMWWFLAANAGLEEGSKALQKIENELSEIEKEKAKQLSEQCRSSYYQQCDEMFESGGGK